MAQAKRGDAVSQTKIGLAYVQGALVQRDYTQAVIWFRLAAEQGNAAAQGMLGVALAKGEGVTRDITEAVKWYRKAAEQGDRGAQYNLGCLYFNGDGVPQDAAEAARWWCESAQQGVVQAQQDLAFIYSGHTKGREGMKDIVKSYAWMVVAAKSGSDEAKRFVPLVEQEMTADQKAAGIKLVQEISGKLPKDISPTTQ